MQVCRAAQGTSTKRGIGGNVIRRAYSRRAELVNPQNVPLLGWCQNCRRRTLLELSCACRRWTKYSTLVVVHDVGASWWSTMMAHTVVCGHDASHNMKVQNAECLPETVRRSLVWREALSESCHLEAAVARPGPGRRRRARVSENGGSKEPGVAFCIILLRGLPWQQK